ncbi:MAG: 2-dehydropantoate 2-reductase [Candidatus Thermoplasmatota archaeon]
MRIIVLGAGSIGSLFGAFLARCNEVVLIRRSYNKKYKDKPAKLRVTGLSDFSVNIPIFRSLDSIGFNPDMVLLTVKSYDTKDAVNMLKDVVDDHTIVLSLQNGLCNLEEIANVIETGNIMGGVTTYGAYLSEPLIVEHTGVGETIIGLYQGKKDRRLASIAKVFNDAGINTRVTRDLKRELWIKAVINSSINPLSAIFRCRNGYLYENPVLRGVVERVCKESACIACAYGIRVSYQLLLKKTFKVIKDTAYNYSSMLQSLNKKEKTEIESINGVLVSIGKRFGCDTSLNTLLCSLILNMEKHPKKW